MTQAVIDCDDELIIAASASLVEGASFLFDGCRDYELPMDQEPEDSDGRRI